MCLCVYFCSVGIFFPVYNCVNKSAPTRTQQRTRHGTHCHLGCSAVRLAPCGVRLCCTVQRVVQACTATTLEGDYAALLMSCGHTLQLYGVARGAAAYLGTVWHALPRCTLIWYCVARGATGYFGTHCHYVVFGTLCYVVFIFCREILPGLQLWEQEMDQAWHALPLGVPCCHTGKHCHRVVIDCAALCNVLCRHAPPLRWRETAVVFILCWHTLPLYWCHCVVFGMHCQRVV